MPDYELINECLDKDGIDYKAFSEKKKRTQPMPNIPTDTDPQYDSEARP